MEITAIHIYHHEWEIDARGDDEAAGCGWINVSIATETHISFRELGKYLKSCKQSTQRIEYDQEGTNCSKFLPEIW
jgi:hypothetical protein